MCHENLEIKRNNTGCLWHELDVLSLKMGTVGGEISISSKDRGLVITDDTHSYPLFRCNVTYITLYDHVSYIISSNISLRVWFHMMLSLFLIASALLSLTNHQIKNLKQSRGNRSSLFLFISLGKIKRSREGDLETNRKEKSSYYWAWDLETHHSYQLLASLKTVQYRLLWPTNMKYLLRFCAWKHSQ